MTTITSYAAHQYGAIGGTRSKNSRQRQIGNENRAGSTGQKNSNSSIEKQESEARVSEARQNLVEKPVWNGRQVFRYVEDMSSAGIAYGEKAKKYYVSQTMQDGELTVDELKKQIQDWFPDYTLTNRKPRDVVNGKHYLYIDDSQLKKMAADAEYRGRVYGLMDREMETGREFTLQYSDGRNITEHITGSVFSLCEENRKYDCGDGIPYLGSGMSDHPFSSTNSRPQFRSMSFVYDNLDPAKSAAKSRATLAAKKSAEKVKEKTREKAKEKVKAKKLAAKKAAEKKETERLAKEQAIEKALGARYAEKRAEQKQIMRQIGENLADRNQITAGFLKAYRKQFIMPITDAGTGRGKKFDSRG